MNRKSFDDTVPPTGEPPTCGVSLFHRRRWTFTPPDQIEHHSCLLAVNGVFYLGCQSGACYALDAHSGDLCWHFAAPGPVVALSQTDTLLLVATDTIVFGLDLKSGQQFWQLNLASTTEDFAEYCRIEDLCVHDHSLLLTVDASSGAMSTSGIYAFDVGSKALLWRIYGWIQSVLTVSDRLLYFFKQYSQDGSGACCVYDMQAQRLLWEEEFAVYASEKEKDDQDVFCLSDDAIVSSDGTIYMVAECMSDDDDEAEEPMPFVLCALNAQTADVLWSCGDADLHENCGEYSLWHLALDNERVYLLGQEGERRYAIDLHTHQMCWAHQPENPEEENLRYDWAGVELVDGMLYLCEAQGLVLALDARTGEECWRHNLDAAIWHGCQADSGVLAVIAGNTLYALD